MIISSEEGIQIAKETQMPRRRRAHKLAFPGNNSHTWMQETPLIRRKWAVLVEQCDVWGMVDPDGRRMALEELVDGITLTKYPVGEVTFEWGSACF